MIVFVYDRECCKDEADDPVDAVLYFHPSWVSDVQKLSLCGQLMGTAHFLCETFFKPKVVSLQSGKFVLKEFGRFILAVGTDRNLSESLLEHRAELLTSLLRFFHRDIQTIYDQFSNNVQYKNLSEKLYHVFETYLPILQYNGNVFQNVPTLRLPKSASNIFLDAMQTLQSCQQTKGVLGGAILYHNKVLATQLSSGLTKNLVLTDPYRIKSTAEPVNVDFYVPIGVQMLIVYVPIRDYRKLLYEAQRAQNVITQTFSNTPLPQSSFHYQKRKIKRDKSLIFTHIPEEASCDHISTGEEIKTKAQSRPNHLPLRFKNVTAKDIPESGFASINFDETDSYPEFIGRTSVCSTPMTENKILHGNIMSICANPDAIVEQSPTDNNIQKKAKRNEDEKKNSNSIKAEFEKFFSNFVSNPYKMQRQNSFTDLQDSLKKITKRLTLRPFGMGLSKLNIDKPNSNDADHNDVDNIVYATDTNVRESDDNERLDIVDVDKRKRNRTITDPTYPVFNSEGDPISNASFQEFVGYHYKAWKEDKINDDKLNKMIADIKDLKSNEAHIQQPCSSKSMMSTDNDPKNNILKEFDETTQNAQPKATQQSRKNLSLPLKPLNDNIDSKDQPSTSSAAGIFERKKLSGMQLTPLMAKLSILALNEERSSGFCSWDTTPGMELSTPVDSSKHFRRRSSVRFDDITVDGTDDTGIQKVELYVCGQQNMTLLLLLEDGAGKKQNLVQTMFETCVSRLTRIETNLTQTLNVNVDGDKSEGGYSYICVDPKWDTVQRGGPWSPNDLISLEYMHKDLNMKYPITDMLLRTEDSVLYGYKYGRNEVFYKQAAHTQNGLPPPADTMGTISLRAKRRLERDHSFMLF